MVSAGREVMRECFARLEDEDCARPRGQTDGGRRTGITLDSPVFVVLAPNAEEPKPELVFWLVDPKPPNPPPKDMMICGRGEGCD